MDEKRTQRSEEAPAEAPGAGPDDAAVSSTRPRGGRATPLLLVGALALLALGLGWSVFQGARSAQRLDLLLERQEAQEQAAAETARSLAAVERRLARAEQVASEATSRAYEQTQRAEDAEARARWAEEESALAGEARKRAERVAQIERQRAQRALSEATRAYAAATAARQAEQQARSEATELQQQSEQTEREMQRLEGALGELAETRRTALGLVMNLGTGVEFDLDRAELRPENRELLARIAGVLLTAGDFHIQVFGHTDDQGGPEYNQDLSERRAQSVVDYLVESGIAPRKISARGLGETQPLVESTSEQARQRNRRVEIAVISYESDYAGTVREEGESD